MPEAIRSESPRVAAQGDSGSVQPPDKEAELTNQTNPNSPQNQLGIGSDNSAEAQRDRILVWLRKAGRLTAMEGVQELDVPRLAARIRELRQRGYQIQTWWVIEMSPAGNNHRVGQYRLIQSKQLRLPGLEGQGGGK